MDELRVSREYMASRQQRQERANEEYFKQMMKCVRKVEDNERKLSHKRSHIYVKIPSMVIGAPLYNRTDCLFFVINSLRDRGINVIYKDPDVLQLSVDDQVIDRGRQLRESFLNNEAKKAK